VKNSKEAYYLPQDDVYVNIGVDRNAHIIVLDLKIKSYHLERTSIKDVNPEKWNNWAMIYTGHEHINDLIEVLKRYVASIYSSKQYVRNVKKRNNKV